MVSSSERLKGIIEDSGLTTNAFSNAIGLKRSQNLYDILNEKIQGLSFELASLIVEKYPQYNRDWIITGKGNKFIEELSKGNNQRIYKYIEDDESVGELHESNANIERKIVQVPTEGFIPVYDVTFTLGFTPTFIDSRNNPEVLGYVNFPELRGSTYVVRGKGNSMAPLICDGDFVGIRPVKNKSIIDFGNPYGIITNDLAIFKRIKKSDNIYYIKLVSDNKEHEDWEILKTDVIHLFIVVGVLSVKSITY